MSALRSGARRVVVRRGMQWCHSRRDWGYCMRLKIFCCLR